MIDPDMISFSQTQAALGPRAVDAHLALGDQLLHARTADRAVLAHTAVQPHPFLRALHVKFDDHALPPLRSSSTNATMIKNTPMHSTLSAMLNTGKS